MNILFAYPYLLHSRVMHGGGVHTLRLARELKQRGHHLFLVCLAELDPEPFRNQIEEVLDIYEEYYLTTRPYIPYRSRVAHLFFSGTPLHATKLFKPEVRDHIQRLIATAKIDITLLVSTTMGEYAKFVKRSKSPLVLMDYEFEARRLELTLPNDLSLLHRLFLWISWNVQIRYEKRLLTIVDHTIVITDQEKSYLLQRVKKANIDVVPLLVDLAEFKPEWDCEEEGAMIFVGSFTHQPNVDAMNWFCRDVLPYIIQDHPSAHLYVIGAHSASMLGNLSSSKVTIVGQVEDVKPWLEKASVVISPIRSGGGARTKNLEALALGRPLVTTTLGSEGLRELPGHSYLAADKPEAFASLVIQLLQDKNFRDHIGKAGRNMVERFHAAKTIGAELEQILLAVSKSERTIDKI